VIDSRLAGTDISSILGYGEGVPIVARLDDLMAEDPDVFMIGVGLYHNQLPEAWRTQIKQALSAGMDVVSGLHFRLSDDPEFSQLAEANGAIIWDSKDPPEKLATSSARAQELDTFIAHTVGSDCRVGKKTTAIEIALEANRRGLTAAFVATGQSGIYISDAGVAVDAVPADFIAGVAEELVTTAAVNHDWSIVEGQGSISHPAYSGVTLGLLHGCMPQALILCHELNLKAHKGWPDFPTRSLRELIEIYEKVAGYLRPAKVVAVSLNTADASAEAAIDAIAAIENEVGLPATDVIRFGAGKIVDALQKYSDSVRKFDR